MKRSLFAATAASALILTAGCSKQAADNQAADNTTTAANNATAQATAAPPVDREERIADLDHLAVGKVDFVEVTRDARPHFDKVERNETSDVLIVYCDDFLRRLGHGDLRRRRRRCLSRGFLFAACGKTCR